ncbi:EmrB/QacA subfamily drug resistance transporter [Kineococcus rhizosphaerae]|uniref:EmrB/QacA subfamily drug resistance transporter n=2 Tax=Kineococcus rhizosphaerae TaxID=559628 RepID=A0A2T0R8G8_9ACTN|nr:MFS transporter [Kineococcus rhizosphaerae]PRY17459.1 EmrB/QacA subfamily drug resistance transporter [Kineococcus rhizosphaerae]
MSDQQDPNRWRALAVCLAVGFMTLLDVSIVNVALPSIEGSLGAGSSEVQWIVAGYALAFGLVLVPAGRIGDLYSRRLMFVIGLAGFVLTSAGAGLVQSATALALVRLAQGITAGLVNPQVLAVIQQLFTGAERGRAFGAFGTTIGLSTAVGPLLGGAILAVFGEENGWRGVFLVNVPIGLVLLPLAWRWLPRAAKDRPAGRVHLDVVGLVLLAAATVFGMLPFVLTTGQGDSPARWFFLVPGALLLVAFVLWERRQGRQGREPVVDGELVRTPSFSVGALVGIAYFAGFTGIFLVVTLYLQSGLGFAPWQAGLVQTPFAVLSGLFAQIGGRQVARRGRGVVVVGLVVVAAGLAAADLVAASVQGTGGAVALSACLAVAGAGSGLVISPNQTLALADVPPRVAGVAGGVLQTGQRVGSAVGVAATTAIFFSTVVGAGLGGKARAAGSGDVPAAVQEVFGKALSHGLRVSLGLVLLALVLAVVDLRRRVGHQHGAHDASVAKHRVERAGVE